MSLHDQVPSVLTHGGHSEKAMLSTIETHSRHHAEQANKLLSMDSTIPAEFEMRSDGNHPRHMYYEGRE